MLSRGIIFPHPWHRRSSSSFIMSLFSNMGWKFMVPHSHMILRNCTVVFWVFCLVFSLASP